MEARGEYHILQLAPEIVSAILQHLHPREIVGSVEPASKAFRDHLLSDPRALAGSLQESYGLNSSTVAETVFSSLGGYCHLKRLTHTLCASDPEPLPFQGVMTDGGVDMDPGQQAPRPGGRYSFLHAFGPAAWMPYCSAGPAPVHVIGALVPRSDEEAAAQARERFQRRIIISVLLEPSSLMLEWGHEAEAILNSLPTGQLRSMFLEANDSPPFRRYFHMAVHRCRDESGPLCSLVSFGEFISDVRAAYNEEPEEDESDGFEDASSDDEDRGAAAAFPGGNSGTKETVEVVVFPGDNRLQWCPQLLRPNFDNSACAVVTNIVISRVGEFSCPVRSGAIFLSCRDNIPEPFARGQKDLTHKNNAMSSPSPSFLRDMVNSGRFEILSGLSAGVQCENPNELDNLYGVLHRARDAGELPNCEHVCFSRNGGVAAEFSPPSPTACKNNGGWELVSWFRFSSSTNDEELEAMLKRPRAARFVAAVFFDIDNRMAEIEDDHELPNVDLAYIALTGHKLTCEAKEQHTESCGGC